MDAQTTFRPETEKDHARINQEVVGYILLSRMFIENIDGRIPVLALAPVAVHPDFQRRGIGSALIQEVIKAASERGEGAILLLGHREYYPRFGFSSSLVATIEHPFDKEHFMGLELKPDTLRGIQGKVKYPKAFDLDPQWTA